MVANAIISQGLLGDFCGVLDSVYVHLYSDRIWSGLVFVLTHHAHSTALSDVDVL